MGAVGRKWGERGPRFSFLQTQQSLGGLAYTPLSPSRGPPSPQGQLQQVALVFCLGDPPEGFGEGPQSLWEEPGTLGESGVVWKIDRCPLQG